MTKTEKSEYFFQQHWESEYFYLEKKPYPPPLEVKWSLPKDLLNCLFLKYV
jgi:hypothetical protein